MTLEKQTITTPVLITRRRSMHTLAQNWEWLLTLSAILLSVGVVFYLWVIQRVIKGDVDADYLPGSLIPVIIFELGAIFTFLLSIVTIVANLMGK